MHASERGFPRRRQTTGRLDFVHHFGTDRILVGVVDRAMQASLEVRLADGPGWFRVQRSPTGALGREVCGIARYAQRSTGSREFLRHSGGFSDQIGLRTIDGGRDGPACLAGAQTGVGTWLHWRGRVAGHVTAMEVGSLPCAEAYRW